MVHASHAINHWWQWHNMSVMASQISGNSEGLFSSLFRLTSNKHQGLCYWPFVRGIHQWPVDSPPNGPVMRKVFPCHDLIMCWCNRRYYVGIVYSTYVHIIAGSVMMRHWLVLSNIVRQSLLWYRLVQFAKIEIGTAQLNCKATFTHAWGSCGAEPRGIGHFRSTTADMLTHTWRGSGRICHFLRTKMVWSVRFRSGSRKLDVRPIRCEADFAPAPPPLHDRACVNACNDLYWSQFSARLCPLVLRVCVNIP